MNEYSKTEEKINVYSHLTGAALGVVALILLIIKSQGDYDTTSKMSFIIFGVSIIILYLASAMYHSATDSNVRIQRKIIDHCAIYILIAGTYTPYALSALGGSYGWIIFGVCWSMATIGISFKVFFTGRFKVVSTVMYVLMGWMILFFIKPLKLAISEEGFNWLLLGGASYSIGALIYLVKQIKFNHGIFHIFVLIGSICHFISIYVYV